MKKVLAFIAVAGLFCGGAKAAEQASSPEDVIKLIEALQKAGLKVTTEEKQNAEVEAETEALQEEVEFDKLVAKLKSTTVSVDYKDTPLAEVLADLQKMTDVNFVLDPKVLKEPKPNGLFLNTTDAFGFDKDEDEPFDATVTLKLEDVKAMSVLGNILRMYDLMAVYSNEALMVTLPQQEEPITLVYDVSVLTAPRSFSFPSKRLLTGLSGETKTLGFVVEEDEVKAAETAGKEPEQTLTGEQLVELLVKATPNGRWLVNRRADSIDATSPTADPATVSWTTQVYSIIYTDGMLIVTQTPDVQMSIANILTALKARR